MKMAKEKIPTSLSGKPPSSMPDTHYPSAEQHPDSQLPDEEDKPDIHPYLPKWSICKLPVFHRHHSSEEAKS
jgi:hypothetical protein